MADVAVNGRFCVATTVPAAFTSVATNPVGMVAGSATGAAHETVTPSALSTAVGAGAANGGTNGGGGDVPASKLAIHG